MLSSVELSQPKKALADDAMFGKLSLCVMRISYIDNVQISWR